MACPAWYCNFASTTAVALVVDAPFERLPLGNILRRRLRLRRNASRICAGSPSCRSAACRCTGRDERTAAVRRDSWPATRIPSEPQADTGRCSRCRWRRCDPCRRPSSIGADATGPNRCARTIRCRGRNEVPSDVGERAESERPGVVFVSAPRAQLHVGDGLDDLRIVAERQARPLVGDRRQRSDRDSTRGDRSRKDSPAQDDCRASSRRDRRWRRRRSRRSDDRRSSRRRSLSLACVRRSRAGRNRARSFHMGTRKTRWRACPKYSCVICSSIA